MFYGNKYNILNVKSTLKPLCYSNSISLLMTITDF